MTLIGLVGALAVLAILAAVIVPSVIRKLDRIAGDKESASLKELGDALEASIRRHRTIPALADMAPAIALERGVNLSDVTTNLRRQPRVLLIHHDFQVGTQTAGQEYVQDNGGSHITDPDGDVIPPIQPRILLLSSIGEPLPAGITSGSTASAADFDAVWDAVDGTLPASAPWAGWRGARDLKIQRINLSPLFVHIVLTTYASDGLGQFRLDSAAAMATAPANVVGIDSFFIQDSVLRLYTHAPNSTLDTEQILTRDISFVYQQNVWRASIEGLGFAGGMDIGSIVDRFLRATHNSNAVDPANQQFNIVQAMMEFMQAYEDWADPPSNCTDNAKRTIAVQKQSLMMQAIQGLYKDPQNYPNELVCPN